MGLRLSSRTRPQDAYIIESETKSVTSAFLSCMVCVLGFQMYEVIAGPQKDPMMEQTMGTAAGRLESLLSDEIQNEDLEGGSAEGDSDGQIFPTQLSSFLILFCS